MGGSLKKNSVYLNLVRKHRWVGVGFFVWFCFGLFVLHEHLRPCSLRQIPVSLPGNFLGDALASPGRKAPHNNYSSTLTAELFATPTAGEAVTSVSFPSAHGPS